MHQTRNSTVHLLCTGQEMVDAESCGVRGVVASPIPSPVAEATAAAARIAAGDLRQGPVLQAAVLAERVHVHVVVFSILRG